MKRLVIMLLVTGLLTTTVLAASTTPTLSAEEIEKRAAYGVHIDSYMEEYRGLEEGIYIVAHKEGYEGKTGVVWTYYNKELTDFSCIVLGEGEGYIEVTERDSLVIVENVVLTKMADIVETEVKEEFEEGVYLIGKDIEPGIYRVEGHGYIQNLRNIFLDTQGQIEDMVILQDGEIVEFEVVEGTYAVRLIGVTAIKVK
jgi:hypothetical protein